MGRKKRKNLGDDDGAEGDGLAVFVPPPPQFDGPPPPPPPVPPLPPPPPLSAVPIDPRDPRQRLQMMQQQQQQQATHANPSHHSDIKTTTASSGYAMTEHSAEIHDEDIYISDGSESDDDEDNTDEENGDADNNNESGGGDGENSKEERPKKGVNVILNNSRMGIMRRGMTMLHPSMMANRQWSRSDVLAAGSASAVNLHDELLGSIGDGLRKGDGDDEEDEEAQKQRREEELAKMDPAQRAAHLLAEKQRKLEEAKINARRLTSEENAGRDPTLFSKRTSFDINFNNMDDKPWTRGNPDDYFNYGFSEEEWLEYARSQLAIRQELIDASRQGRMPDPAIVPVVPRVRKKPEESTAVSEAHEDAANQDASSSDAIKAEANAGSDDGNPRVVGPIFVPKKEDRPMEELSNHHANVGPTNDEMRENDEYIETGEGGAWGAGAAPGSMLARLMEEQEQQEQQQQYGYDNHHQDSYQSNSGPDVNKSYYQDGVSSVDYQQPPYGDFPSHGVKSDQSNDFHHQRQQHQYHQNHWNNNHLSNFQGDGPASSGPWEMNDGFRAGRADEGFRGGRGGGRNFGGGRGGRFSDGFQQGGRGGRGWGGRGDFQNNRKRPRNDY